MTKRRYKFNSPGRNAPWVPSTLFIARDETGASAVEFVLVLPVLLLALFSIIKFGIVLNNKLELTGAAQSSARVLAIGRSSPTPYTDGTNAFYLAAPNLKKASTSVTVSVNNVACNNDKTCQAALAAATGLPVSISATYPCDLTIMGLKLVPTCTLSSQTAERIE